MPRARPCSEVTSGPRPRMLITQNQPWRGHATFSCTLRRFTELNAPHALHRHRTVTRSPSPGTFTSPARPLGGTRPAGREGSGARRGGRLQPGRPEPATRRPLACGEPSPASKCIRATPPRRGTRTGPTRDTPHGAAGQLRGTPSEDTSGRSRNRAAGRGRMGAGALRFFVSL